MILLQHSIRTADGCQSAGQGRILRSTAAKTTRASEMVSIPLRHGRRDAGCISARRQKDDSDDLRCTQRGACPGVVARRRESAHVDNTEGMRGVPEWYAGIE